MSDRNGRFSAYAQYLVQRILLRVYCDHWPAAGFEDTELSVFMEPEVGHGKTEVFSGVQAWGYKADQGAWDLGSAGLARFGSARHSFAQLGEGVFGRSGTSIPWARANEARADVFDYIERFYNVKRRHSAIKYESPIEFEMGAGLA